MKLCRLQALIEEIGNDWDRLNLSAKVLVFIGIFLLLSVIFVDLYNTGLGDFGSRIDVIFRSSLVSVFGFLLSSNIKNTCNKDNKNSEEKVIKDRIIKDEMSITEECKIIAEERNNYYYKDGNSIQILIALIVILVSALFMLSIYIFNIDVDTAILGQFRDFMCMSIGFLLGESKIKSE